ncbi:MAG TPA: hypothetical protein VF622_13215, partial [Segetibacter sp.]
TMSRYIITSELVGRYEGENLMSFNLVTLGSNACRLLLRLFINPSNSFGFLFTSFAFILISATILFLFRRNIKVNRSAVLVFAAITIILLLPIISIGIPVTSYESGRFLYIPSIFLVAGLSIAAVDIYNRQSQLRSPFLILIVILTCYWLSGKYKASKNYKEASAYASSTQNIVQRHFSTTTDTLYIDTLHKSIQRLPVYRLGFKTGVKWLNSDIDTNKIVVRHYIDEVQKK